MKTLINLKLTMKYKTSTQGINLIFINLLHIHQFFTKGLVIWEQSYVMDFTTHIKVLTNNIKQSESSLLGFIHQYTFYTINEYFNHQHTKFNHYSFTHFHLILVDYN